MTPCIVHGILQARILEWVAFSFSTESSQLIDQIQVSCTAGRFFTNRPIREALQNAEVCRNYGIIGRIMGLWCFRSEKYQSINFSGLMSKNIVYTHFWAYFDLESVQFSSVAQSCLTFCDPMNCSTPGLPVHHQLPEFIQTHVHWVDDAIQPSHPLLSPSPSALNLSQHEGLFKWVIRWPKYWSFSINISPSSEHPGLISFSMDCLDLLAVQGTLKSLLKHHSSKASILC